MSDEESDDGLDDDPILEYRAIPHMGAVNRIRVMPHPTSHIVSTWSETGKVHIWDLTQSVNSIGDPGLNVNKVAPMFTITQHPAEGYAMDWSNVAVGK